MCTHEDTNRYTQTHRYRHKYTKIQIDTDTRKDTYTHSQMHPQTYTQTDIQAHTDQTHTIMQAHKPIHTENTHADTKINIHTQVNRDIER